MSTINIDRMTPVFLHKQQAGNTSALFLPALILLFFAGVNQLEATTCTFSGTISSATNPFSTCPMGTDTIIIQDTLYIAGDYTTSFNGVLIVDGGRIIWSQNGTFTLGHDAKLILINGGQIKPTSSDGQACNANKVIAFDDTPNPAKVVSCSGGGADYSFDDVNSAGCITIDGICCNVYITETDNSGYLNDKTLCAAGDAATLSVGGSGQLDYTYTWIPVIGSGAGPYTVHPLVTTQYTVTLSGQFDPTGNQGPYQLSCSGSVIITINPTISLSTSVTNTICPNANGAIALTVTGGTGPYTYDWSNDGPESPDNDPKDLANLTVGTYTVTVTDAKGCTATTSATVLTNDMVPPSISCPAVISPIECPASPAFITPMVFDICDPSPVVTFMDATMSGICTQEFTVTRTWTATDANNNTATCQQIISVTDNTAPSATAPLTIDIECGNIVTPGATTYDGFIALGGMANDLCSATGSLVIAYTDGALVGSNCSGTIARTYTVTDACGNTTTVTQTITVTDNTAPMATAPTAIDIECGNAAPTGATTYAGFVALGGTAHDNCTADASLVIAYSDAALVGSNCNGSIARTYTVTDACGNTTTVTQTITVTDNTAPMATAPSSIGIKCGNAAPTGATTYDGFVTLGGTASDNCTANGALVIAYTDGPLVGTDCNGTIARTYTVTDACGNTTSVTQTITVTDNTFPTATAPTSIDIECGTPAPVGATNYAEFVVLSGTASDNCTADASLVIAYTDGPLVGTDCSGTIDRTYTVTDACGNTTTVTQSITVSDNTVPTALCQDITISLDNMGNATITPAQINDGSSDNCSSVTLSAAPVSFTCANVGVNNVTLTVTDECNNESTCIAVVTVAGSVDMSIVRNNEDRFCSGGLLDYTISTGAIGSNVTFDLVLSPFSNAANPADLTDDNILPLTIPGLTINSTTPYHFTQVLNNAIGSFDRGRVRVNVINVVLESNPGCTVAEVNGPFTDVLPKPRLNDPGDVLLCTNGTISLDLDLEGLPSMHVATAGYPAYIDWTVTTSNNGGGIAGASNGSVEIYNNLGIEQAAGDIVQMLVNLGSSEETATYTITPRSAGFFNNDPSDDCIGDPVIVVVTMGQIPTGTNTLLPAVCSGQTFNIDPQTYISNNVSSTFSWTASYSMGLNGGAGSGNGNLSETLINPTNGILNAIYTVTPTSLEGCAGNPFTITVPVNPATTLSCPSSIVSTTSSDQDDDCLATALLTHPTPDGLCIPNVLSVNFTNGTPAPAVLPMGGSVIAGTSQSYLFGVGQTIVTYTNTDNAGISATCSLTVTVTDDEAPLWQTAPGALDATLNCEDAAGLAAAQLLNPVAMDNCDLSLLPVKSSGMFLPGSCPNAGTYTNTWTATDAAGNTSMAYTQTITIQDIQAPVISGVPANTNGWWPAGSVRLLPARDSR